MATREGFYYQRGGPGRVVVGTDTTRVIDLYSDYFITSDDDLSVDTFLLARLPKNHFIIGGYLFNFTPGTSGTFDLGVTSDTNALISGQVLLTTTTTQLGAVATSPLSEDEDLIITPSGGGEVVGNGWRCLLRMVALP